MTVMMMMRRIGSHGMPLRRLYSLPIQSSKHCSGATLNCSLVQTSTPSSTPPLGVAEMLATNNLEEKIMDKVNQFLRNQRSEVGDIVADLNQLKALRHGSNKGGMVAPTCRMEKAKTGEQVSIYFRAPALPLPNMLLHDTYCSWYAIPRQQEGNADDFLSPIFHEPPLFNGFTAYIPVAVGPCVFIIGAPELSPSPTQNYAPSSGMWYRRVHYLDTQSGEKKWEEAPTLEKAPINCYAFALDGKIYLLGSYSRNTFSLQCLDCHKLKEGWKSLLCSDESQSPSTRVFAHTIEYKTVGDPSSVGRAIMVANTGRICYDFQTNKIDFYEDRIGVWRYFAVSGVVHNGAVYLLAGGYDGDLQLMVYDLEKCKWCPTPVIGFDKYENALPKIEGREEPKGEISVALLHLGEERFCLIWLDSGSKVRCTKFNINVIQGKHCAEEVSTHVYRLKGFLFGHFKAVTI